MIYDITTSEPLYKDPNFHREYYTFCTAVEHIDKCM